MINITFEYIKKKKKKKKIRGLVFGIITIKYNIYIFYIKELKKK